MKAEGGRAATAPTLNSVESVVIGWHALNTTQEENINFVGMKAVRFDDRVQVRAILAEGKGRKTPETRAREKRTTREITRRRTRTRQRFRSAGGSAELSSGKRISVADRFGRADDAGDARQWTSSITMQERRALVGRHGRGRMVCGIVGDRRSCESRTARRRERHRGSNECD